MSHRHSRAKLATSTTPPVLTELSLLRQDDGSFLMTGTIRHGRAVITCRRWQFALDPCGDPPPDVVVAVWDLVQRPWSAISNHTYPTLF